MRPRADSRGERVRVERGNMPYSLVIQPLPELRIQWGTDSSMEAVQMTRVLPISMRQEPSEVRMKSGVIFTGRIWSAERLSERKIFSGISSQSSVIGCENIVREGGENRATEDRVSRTTATEEPKKDEPKNKGKRSEGRRDNTIWRGRNGRGSRGGRSNRWSDR